MVYVLSWLIFDMFVVGCIFFVFNTGFMWVFELLGLVFMLATNFPN